MWEDVTRYSHIFTWNIENFNFCIFNDEGLRSPLFVADSIVGTIWRLKLDYKGYLNSTENVSCWLHRVQDDSSFEKVCCEFKIEIIGKNGEPVVSKESKNIFMKDSNHGWKDYAKMKELKNRATFPFGMLTIKCYMVGDAIPNTLSKNIAWTRICVNRCSFKWPFVSLSDVESMVFQCPAKSYFEISSQLLDEDLVIHIEKSGINTPPQMVRCTIVLLNSDDSECVRTTSNHFFHQKASVWEFPCFDKKLLTSGDSDIMERNCCSMKFDFSISDGSAQHEIKSELVPSQDVPNADMLSPMQDDLRILLESQKFADVKIHVQDETFLVHKNILCARSPVFSAMFENNMLETETGILDIQDIEKLVLKSFLTFLYTGNVDVDSKTALKLLMVADKYQVSSLKDKCCNFLGKHLTFENICEVLLTADMIGQERLKESAINFVLVNKGRILFSDKWKLLIEQNFKLATDILWKISDSLGSAYLQLRV